MNKHLRILLLVTTSVAFAAISRAETVFTRGEGVYISAQAMFNHPQDVETNSLTHFRSSLKTNVAYSGVLGYKFSILRIEAELQHYNQDAAQGTTNVGAAPASGGYSQLAGFANGFVDIPLFAGLGVYGGGGLGFARVNFDNFTASQGGATVVQYSGAKTAFAYQVAGGVEYSFGGRATVHAGYRIVKQGDVRVSDSITAAQQTVKLGENRLFEIGLAIGF